MNEFPRSDSKYCTVPIATFLAMADICEAFMNLTFSPASSGKLILNGNKAIIQMTDTDGSGGVRLPYQLIPSQATGGAWSLRVVSSTLGGDFTSGMSAADNPIFKLSGITGNGVVYGRVDYDEDGQITDRQISNASTLPSNSDGSAYVAIGYYTTTNGVLTARNMVYGPITANICRNWFVDPPTYSVSFSGAAVNIIQKASS